MKIFRYFVRLSYNGKNYHGWQIQPNGNSVQAELTKAFRLILRQKNIEIYGAGRTDAGVHAKNFVAHFDVENEIDDIPQMIYKINGFLPKDIAIHDIYKVKNNAHSRFDAKSRTYQYFISICKEPFSQEFSWYLFGEMNLAKMNEAASKLMKYRDFSSFSKLHTQVKTNNCKIFSAQWKKIDCMLIFEITADRFLRNMVRAIVGTLVEIGKGKISIDDFEEIILSKNRSKAGESAPAHALFLTNIEYPEINISELNMNF